jgi:DNA-nicking Smr family endonuclease
MKEAHLEAAKAIFRTRNPLFQLEKGQIDLHGLHVMEAKECIRDILPLFEEMHISPVRIVTGSGK